MDKIVVFQSYYNPIEASIIKERLMANGIRCFLSDEHTSTINPLYNQALGGVKLRLFEEDVQSAKSILADEVMEINLEEIGVEDSDEQLPDVASVDQVCINCGSSNVGYVHSTKRRFSVFTMIISFLLFVYPFKARKSHHCFDCQTEF